ncbi:MAG TPA: 16S rRNA (guanine(527)-N(7))-methyltransferase RsmG [Kineosporiaceae bacterium]|nr:16S rRNA (guanine(527)-N(7))-methyltransferase RsmG [Kineosporiaceae bacterium]
MTTTAGESPGEDYPGGTAELPSDAVLAAFFGDRAPLALAFAAHLATSGASRGLIGPREVPRLWTRHLLNCAALAPLLPAGGHVVDVGSGAGLPGLVLAVARPDVQVTLVEPLLRRVTWLHEVLDDLQLDGVEVLRARAEEVRGMTADVATSRAVAALDRLSGWCLPLVREGGTMLAIKGQTAPDELEQAEPLLRSLGAISWSVRELGGDVLEEPTTVIEVLKGSLPTAPRPAGVRTARDRRRR